MTDKLKIIKIEQDSFNKHITCSQPAPQPVIHKTTSEWTRGDYLGAIRCRISAFRMRYAVESGLYAVGAPDMNSDVFVSANYKLSFDILRRELKGLNSWILVLDTKGINVWCAAGKGTFGTDELIRRIHAVQLQKVVNHKRIIIPQLGAVGVNARTVQKQTDFRIYFGPVYAKDIHEYLKTGYKKTEQMRKIHFNILDRLILTPMEINPAMKKFPIFAMIVLLLFGIQPSGIIFKDAWFGGLPLLLLGLTSVFSGALITPVLLPFIPSRSFAVKGWITGMPSVILALQFISPSEYDNIIIPIVAYLFFPLASSYIALQFTGATTFTSISGVKKELKTALPIYLSSIGISVILLIVYKLYEWRVI